jgi:hypothetical protein
MEALHHPVRRIQAALVVPAKPMVRPTPRRRNTNHPRPPLSHNHRLSSPPNLVGNKGTLVNHQQISSPATNLLLTGWHAQDARTVAERQLTLGLIQHRAAEQRRSGGQHGALLKQASARNLASTHQQDQRVPLRRRRMQRNHRQPTALTRLAARQHTPEPGRRRRQLMLMRPQRLPQQPLSEHPRVSRWR